MKFQNPRLAAVIILVSGLCFGRLAPGVTGQSQASTPDDRARLLAAMPLSSHSPLKKFEHLPACQAEAEFLHAKWLDTEKNRWQAMTGWMEAEVHPHINPKEPLFYMFGGPDFLSAHIFYPNAIRYFLCGLETIGRVPEMEGWSDQKISTAVEMVSASLKPALDQGFFITSEMGGNLLKSDAYGVLPLLYVFIVRTGNEITNVQYVSVDNSGELLNVPGDEPLKGSTKGVRITFHHGQGSPSQELYYFRADLSDKALQADNRLLLFLSKQGQVNSFLKAASYLMHSKEFSMIRGLLLAQSASVLQDDSGLPFRAFDPAQWSINLYGNYIGPIREIAWAEQKDLRKAYSVPGAAKPLPFRTGYGSRERANMLFATHTSVKTVAVKHPVR